jgi:hypothetical protein
MAFLQPLNIRCHAVGCRRPAVEELFSDCSVPYGRYCKSCARRELKRLKILEARERKVLRKWATMHGVFA